MSFLLDVADPSIHFHARQGCNTPSPSTSPSKTPSINPIDAAASSSSSSSSSKDTKSSIAGRPISALTSRLGAIATASSTSSSTTQPPSNTSSSNHLGVPTSSMFSAMSRMIRQVSASTTPLGSSPPSGANTPDASSAHVSDPFHRATPVSTIGSALSSPWMKPSVCDDDHMNKLVSFQL
ncbi:hypothetical protein K457DRAFT_157206 [Linnemannia elongata AG-77]|uniref:Uncharacterized protein n=1 Tax=Linnemannia elongata AG-77 TaxID=1314771 RepID=A0A197JRM4_9FUNG|nr:hypothetical protein K457DRAFT_157206 [Linnemannia elongata AG-77]